MRPRTIALRSNHKEKVDWPDPDKQEDPFGGVQPRGTSPSALEAPLQLSSNPHLQVESPNSRMSTLLRRRWDPHQQVPSAEGKSLRSLINVIHNQNDKRLNFVAEKACNTFMPETEQCVLSSVTFIMHRGVLAEVNTDLVST